MFKSVVMLTARIRDFRDTEISRNRNRRERLVNINVSEVSYSR